MTQDSIEPKRPSGGREQHQALDQLLGIVDDRAADGRAECDVEAIEGEPVPTTFAISSAVDISIVRAASTTVAPPEVMNGTAELNVSYLRNPTGTAHVVSTVVGRSPHVRLVEFSVTDADGEFARGRSTYAVRPAPADAASGGQPS